MKRKGGAAVTGDKLAHKRQAVEVQEGGEVPFRRSPRRFGRKRELKDFTFFVGGEQRNPGS
jgi:hypothetical protein